MVTRYPLACQVLWQKKIVVTLLCWSHRNRANSCLPVRNQHDPSQEAWETSDL